MTTLAPLPAPAAPALLEHAPATHGHTPATHEHTPATHPCLGSIMRRLGANLLVACVIPGALFYTALQTVGMTWAIVAALTWGYGALAWRRATGRPVSGLLLLTVSVLTLRSVFTLTTGDTFAYFLQPLLSDAALATLFLVSLLTARPVVSRLASDFYPMSLELAADPSVTRLFQRLTLMWGCVCLTRSALGFWLLESLSVSDYVLVKELCFLALTIVAVSVTVVSSIGVLRRGSLLPA